MLSKGQQRGNLFAGYVFHTSIFMKALADVNVPAECIRNDKHLELFRAFLEKGQINKGNNSFSPSTSIGYVTSTLKKKTTFRPKVKGKWLS